jgi:hypothetical protein
MKELKKSYLSPIIEKIVMDNDISLALESPFGDPAAYSPMEFSPESTAIETMPGL